MNEINILNNNIYKSNQGWKGSWIYVGMLHDFMGKIVNQFSQDLW
jgi:hypothetical protein